MTPGRLLAITVMIATGVLLPKILPAVVVGGRLNRRADLFLCLLPAALLAGLVTVEVVGAVTAPHARLQVVAAVAAAAVMAAVTRRGLLSMVCGWVVLAVGTLL